MPKETTWVKAITLSLISSILALVIFLLYQVIMADALLSIITSEYEAGLYLNSNLVLFTGLMLILISSLLINLVFMRKYTLMTRILANVFVSIITLLILLAYSWISITLVYSEQYQTLTLLEQVRLIPYFYIILSAYILPSPVLFWILGLIVYHMILIIFIKYFYVEKKLVSKKVRKIKKKDNVNVNKYSML